MCRKIMAVLRIVLLSVLLFFGLLTFLRYRYQDVIFELAETQVRNVTSDLTNIAIDSQIQSGSIAYDRIVYFEKDVNGKITALKTNIGEVNRLKTDVLKTINQKILSLDTSDIGIPMGSLLVPELLSGRGPVIPIRILAIRNSDAEFYSDFSQAGINQTLHRLIMKVNIDVSVLVLGQTDSFTVTSQVIIAETVIIGDVPDTYLQTGGFYGSQKESGRIGSASE